MGSAEMLDLGAFSGSKKTSQQLELPPGRQLRGKQAHRHFFSGGLKSAGQRKAVAALRSPRNADNLVAKRLKTSLTNSGRPIDDLDDDLERSATDQGQESLDYPAHGDARPKRFDLFGGCKASRIQS